MKPGTDTPDAGKIVETTTRRRIVPLENERKERTTPEFWEYLENLPPSRRDDHFFYIYRDEPGPTMAIAKHTWQTALDAGIPWNDREEAEAGFAMKYGGRTFRVIVKDKSERVTIGRLYVNAHPKALTPAPAENSGVVVTPMTEASATADVAKQAMHTIAHQDREAVSIGMDALSTAAQVIKNFSQPAAPAATATDDVLKQALAVMLQRAMNPPDPMETMLRMLTVMKEVNATTAPAGTPGSPQLTRILDLALDRFVNPVPTGPSSSAGAELVRQLPQVAGYVAESIREWRMGSEAQRDTAAMMRGQQPPAPTAAPPANGARPNPALPAAVIPASPASTPGVPMGTPSLEFIESKIVEILREPISADEAADEAIEFLDRLDISLVKQLSSLGENGLLALFQTRPVLRLATENTPRLLEFIRAFLKYANESEAPVPGTGTDPVPKPN